MPTILTLLGTEPIAEKKQTALSIVVIGSSTHHEYFNLIAAESER